MKHILIDFENVQPEASQLNGLDDDSCHIWLFLGKLQQKTLSVELCEALCRFGKNVHFVRVAKTGKNALDFYLAYYLGKITEQDNEALVCILSRDSGFDVLVEHLDDVGHCKGIVRLAALEDARKNEAELLEAGLGDEGLSKEYLGNSLVQDISANILYKDPSFIGECTRKVFLELASPEAFRPSVMGNLRLRLRAILSQELGSFTEEQQAASIELIVQKLKDKELITQNTENGFIEYHVSSDDILEKITQRLIQSKAKSIDAARNVLMSHAKMFFVEVDENTVSDILKYCVREGILRIKDKKIEYAPFDLAVKIPSQATIVSQSEDIQIMQSVGIFFNKCAKNKPQTRKALSNSFKSLLKLNDKQIEKLIQVLIDKKKFTVSETGKITYKK